MTQERTPLVWKQTPLLLNLTPLTTPPPLLPPLPRPPIFLLLLPPPLRHSPPRPPIFPGHHHLLDLYYLDFSF